MSASTATLVIFASAMVVATAAAVRSTWSPCGLSMLSTITPPGERARGHSYAATASWFIAGATFGGVTLGALAAAGALGVRALSVSGGGRMWAAGAAVLACLLSDAAVTGRRLPVHRRQVNERWLDAYRPWVYGAGFGWQVGAGLVTYITSAAVYLAVVLAALTAAPLAALAVATWFGLLRGLAVLLTRRVESPAQLFALHRRVEAVLPTADRGVRGAEAAAALIAAAALATPVAVVLFGGTALLLTLGVPLGRRLRRPRLRRPAAVSGQVVAGSGRVVAAQR